MPSGIVNGLYVFLIFDILFKQNLMAKLLTRAWLFLNAQKCTLIDTNLLYLELNMLRFCYFLLVKSSSTQYITRVGRFNVGITCCPTLLLCFSISY